MAHKTGVHQPNAEASIAILAGRPLLPNSGIPLDLNWVQEVRVNTSAVERRAQSAGSAQNRKKGMAGGVASARDHLHGPDHALRR